MRLRHGNVRLLVAIVLAATVLPVAVAFMGLPPAVAAQDEALPCPGMMNVGGDRQIDATLSVAGSAEVIRRGSASDDGQATPDEVQLIASSTGSPKCIWIQRAGPGEEFSAFANFVLRPDELPTQDSPGPLPGEYCYRFFAVSDAGSSEPSVSCVEIATPRQPLGPHDVPPGPPDAGTGTWSPGNGVLRGGFAALGLSLIALSALMLRTNRNGRRRPAEDRER